MCVNRSFAGSAKGHYTAIIMAKKGKKNKKAASGEATLATNRRARHDYKILEEYECGIVLLGTEIKSLREGKISLNDAFATIDDGEVYLRNLHIPEYSMGSWTNHSPRRTCKLAAPPRNRQALRAGAQW